MKKKILLTPCDDAQRNGFHASLDGERVMWQPGENEAEAIGKLVLLNPTLFNIEIVRPSEMFWDYAEDVPDRLMH